MNKETLQNIIVRNDLIKNEKSPNNENKIDKDEVFKTKIFNKFKCKCKDQKKIKEKINSNKYAKSFFNFFSKYCKKDDLTMSIIVILSMIFYYIGLAKCDADPSECTIKRGMIFYFMIGICSAISAVLYSTFVTSPVINPHVFFCG